MQQWLVPRSGTAQLSRVIDLLERAGPRGESDPGRAMHDVADRLGRRSLVIAQHHCVIQFRVVAFRVEDTVLIALIRQPLEKSECHS